MNKIALSLLVAVGLSAASPVTVADPAPDAAVLVDAGSGSGSSSAAPAAPAPEAKTPPSEALPNPVDDPIAAIETLRAQRKQGWAVTILAAVCMLVAGLSRAGSKWPDVKPLAWVRTNKTAILVSSGLALTSAAAFNALALGGTWLAALWAAVGAGLSLLHPGGDPS